MTKFRGWNVLGAGFINAMLIAGAAIYSYGAFVKPIEAEFGLTREQANIGIQVLYVSMMIWAVLVGRWLEKYSAKKFSMAGGLAFGIGFLLIYFAKDPRLILLAIIIPISFGFTAAGPFLANALAARWFTKKRGRALGIATVASSMGGLVMVPIVGNLIEKHGWRQTTLILAVGITALILLISWLFVIGRPEDIDQTPDGLPITQNTSMDIPTHAPFINRPAFWLIGLGVGLLLGSDQALLTSLIPFGLEEGFTLAQAKYLMVPMTLSAIAGKLIVGWLAEKYDKPLLFGLVCISNIIFLIALLMSPSFTNLMIIAGFVGLAIGGVYPVWTTLVADHFGRDQFAKVIGAMNLITVPLMVASITIAGRTRDITGDYDLAWKIFIPQVIAAALIIFGLKMLKKL